MHVDTILQAWNKKALISSAYVCGNWTENLCENVAFLKWQNENDNQKENFFLSFNE